jgi:hypothetical protein
MRRQSRVLVASGFSHSTCNPALAARTVHAQCREFGSAM